MKVFFEVSVCHYSHSLNKVIFCKATVFDGSFIFEENLREIGYDSFGN